MQNYKVTVLGAGLAGCEAALWLAGKGVQVELYEQKPTHFSPAHKSEGFAELICSNSLKAERLDSASGLLKEEMRRMGSQLLNAAETARVAAGGALAVDRDAFSAEVTRMVESCENITVHREQVETIDESAPILVATGPLTDPKKSMGGLIGGEAQKLMMARALYKDAPVLVLDEPTAALTQPEVEELFRIMNDLRDKGIGMIYISHRMDEINRISDRVTVMRDGEYVGTLQTKDTTKDEIVKMMVGRVVYTDPKTKSNVPNDAPTVLEVKNMNSGNMVKNVSFKLRKGEILGFAGLMGAGRTELARAIYGADEFDSGEVFINGKKVKIRTPESAVKHGICYLSEDRKQYGLLLIKSVAENSVLASLDDYIKFGWINDAKAKKAAEEVNKKLRTKTPSMDQLLKNLSGGNQQKVIVARWLLKNSDIFIFDEPTRGIDVGAKSEMYDLMEELAAQGKSIIMISSELSEIQRLSDRVIVMCEGRVTADLSIDDGLTQEEIMKYATMRN